MSAPLSIEERKRLLEDGRRALEERKQVVASLTQVEEEEIKTEEAVEVSAKKRELEERKRMLLEKKNAILAKRQTEDEEIRKQETDELEKKKNLQIEEKKREFEERKRKLEEKKKQLEEQRKKEDEQLRNLELEEEKKIASKKVEIEERRKALEEKKKQLASKRKEEEEKQKAMEATLSTTQAVPAIDIEQKRAELQDKKRRLDEKKKQLEEIREKEAREKKEAEELEQKRLQLESRKKALEQRKKQLEDQRSGSSDKLVITKPTPSQTQPQSTIAATEKPDEIAPTPAQIQNQNQSLAELEAKKRELERRKKELEERRKQTESPGSPQVLRPKESVEKEPVQASTSSSNVLDDKKRELEEKKRELERRKKALEDAKREDEEQKRREQALEFERRKQELEDRRRQMEEKKRLLQEEKERAVKEAQQRALEEQEEINRKKQDLEDRRKQIQERKRLLDEIRKKEEEEVQKERQQEEELQRKKMELDQKKKLLEEKRKQLEAEKKREREEQEEMEALEKKKKELEERKERLRQRKKDLDEVKQKEKQEQQTAVKIEPKDATNQLVVPSTDPKANQNAAPATEENEEAVEQEIQRKKAEIEERKKRIEEKKKFIEMQRQKEEEEKRQREEEEKRAQEEQEVILTKRREIEQRRKELEERKKALEQLKQEEEKKIIVLEGEQQQLAQLEEISAIQLKKAQLEDRKRILEDRKKALEERRQQEKQEQQEIEKKAREEELRQKQEEEQLEKRRKDLEERRRKLSEKRLQLKELQSAEVAQNAEDGTAPSSEDAEKELDLKKQELEERKRQLAERRKQLQELKSLNASTTTTETEKEELTMIEQTKAEIEYTQNELESKLQTLEAKQTVQINTNEDMLASLSSKEKQLLNLLTPDQQKALEQLSPAPNRAKSNTFSKKKTADSLGYDPKAFQAEQDRLKQQEKEHAKKLKKEQKEKEKERERKEKEDKERQRKEQKEQEKLKKQREKELAKTKPIEAVYVPKTELSEAEKMFLASMAPTDRSSFLAATPTSPQPDKPPSQSPGTLGKSSSVRKKTSSKGSFIMPEPSVFADSTSEYEEAPRLVKHGSFTMDSTLSPSSTMPRGVVLPGLTGSSGTLRSTPLHEAVRNNDKELFKNLLQMEDINVRDTQGQTPLHVAAFKGSLEMVTFILTGLADVLVGKKVELNLQDNNGWTPLHAAAFNASAKTGTLDHLKTCKFLLEQEGINPHLQSKDSSLAAHFFFRVTCANKPEWEALYNDVVQLMAKKNVDFNIQNNKGETCLHQAAFRGSFEGVQFLVNLTENLSVLALSGGQAPVAQPAPEPTKEKSKVPGVFKNLFTAPSTSQQNKQLQRTASAMQPLTITTQPSQSHKVNLNIQNQVGETAIHCAAKAGHSDIVQFLVANWADVNIKSEQGYPKDVALSFNQSEIAKYLEDLCNKESQTALSPALWFKIFSYLSGRDICRCSTVCKFFRRISDNDAVWKELCISRRIASVINPRCKTKNGFSKIWKKDYIMVKNLRLNPEKTDKLAKSAQLVKAQAIARGWVARHRYAKLKKMRVHRDQIAKELVETEQTYVDNLKILVKAFLTPLRNTANTPENPIITKQQIKILFSDIEVIQNTNNNLLQKLRSRLDSWSNGQKIGDIFVSMTDTFKLYTQYINNFDRALLTLEECMKNPAFAEFIKPRESALKSTINSLMILPIQRIPRYNLLLTELVKNTWPEHVDYTNLRTALQKMQSITTLLNEKKREAENKEKITAVQNAIEPSAGLLYTKSRRFVAEGEFIETIGKGQKIPLYIFLFSDMIILCRPQKKRTIPPKYKLISQEKLFTVDVQEEYSKEAEAVIGQNMLLQSFVLNTMTGEKLITAQKKEIRDQWVNEIKNCITKSKKNRKVGGIESESAEQDLALLEQNINNEDLKPEAKIKILEAALQATKKQLQDEKRVKEQLTLTKQNLEMQVKQAMTLLTKETKDKLDALAEVRTLKEQVFSLQSASPQNAELDAISKMALEGLTEEQKEWLSHLGADEKQDRIDLVRMADKKELKKLSSSRSKTLRGKEKEEKKHKKDKEDKKDTEKLKARPSFSSESPASAIHLQELVKQGNKSGIQHALAKGNAALNSQDSEGLTALHFAASEGHYDILKMLLDDSKIDVNIQDINGWTPLHSAAYVASKNPTMDNLKICELLLHNANIKADLTNNNLNTALHLFVKVPCSSSKSDDYKNLFETVISQFLEKTDPNIQNQKGETCLHSAVFAANQQVIERLLTGPSLKLAKKKSERKFTISFSSGQPSAALKESHERRVDLNITSDDHETPLAVAAKLGDLTIITSFVKHFADLTTRAKLGTAADIARFFQHTKAAELIDNTMKAEKTKLPPTVWHKIFQYVAGNDIVSKSMQSVHIICKEWRRLSGRVKTESTKPARDKFRENASAMSSVISRQRAATISMNNAMPKPDSNVPENENWKIIKQNLEMQLKQAVTLLTDETKKRQQSEKRVKELEVELKAATNPEQIHKLEEQLKKQRLAYDNMQQQFVMNLDKITTLEKQVKQLKAEKLEENTKYEERVYFMEKQAKEKRDEVTKHYEGQLRELSRAKHQAEEANKSLKATIKELSSRAQQGTAAPPIPDRPGSKRASMDEDSGSEKDKRLSKALPNLEKGRKPPAPPTYAEEDYGTALSPTAIPTSLIVQAQRQHTPTPRIIHDFWEGSSKLIVAVDVPGVDLDLLDFHITRFTVLISRKVGVFEEKYFGSKYKPVALQRFEKNHLNQVVKEQIVLPCAVQPNKKQAYYFNGTVYLQLEKLSDSSSSVEDSDWQKKPVF